MELVLILGLMLTAIGILVGLYLPILVAQYTTPTRIRLYLIIGVAVVVIGMACEIFAVWPVTEIVIEQQPSNELNR
jgi:steroid 5-alpha reductase family enzyme